MNDEPTGVTVEPRITDAFRALVEVLKPNLLVEFGSWEGRSALGFVQLAREYGLSTTVICVDTWLGSFEHWANFLPDSEWSFERLRVVDGEPRVLDTFRAAIDHHGAAGQVSIVRAPTEFATNFLRARGVVPDLIYVDADHSYAGVLKDLGLASSLLGPGGVIAGDDWGWSSVQLAVVRFARKLEILTSTNGQNFLLLNNGQGHLIQDFIEHGWTRERRVVIVVRWARRTVFRALRRKTDRLYTALGLGRVARWIRRK